MHISKTVHILHYRLNGNANSQNVTLMEKQINPVFYSLWIIKEQQILHIYFQRFVDKCTFLNFYFTFFL